MSLPAAENRWFALNAAITYRAHGWERSEESVTFQPGFILPAPDELSIVSSDTVFRVGIGLTGKDIDEKIRQAHETGAETRIDSDYWLIPFSRDERLSENPLEPRFLAWPEIDGWASDILSSDWEGYRPPPAYFEALKLQGFDGAFIVSDSFRDDAIGGPIP
jgi:hypothetical protein